MSNTTEMGQPSGTSERSTGELVQQMSEQVSTLVRDELKLAQLEMTRKGKQAGIGVGMFGGSGAIALYGVGCLIACAILGISRVLAPWLSALIVGVALLAVAGIAALAGKSAAAGYPACTAAGGAQRQDRRGGDQGKGTAMTSEPVNQSGPPDDLEQLQTEIEQTREHLGDTVDQLAAKADVKAQAQAKAADLTQRAKQAGQARQHAADTVGQVRQQAADTASQARQRAAAAAATGQEQLQARTPEGVKQAASVGVAKARQYQTPLLIAVGAVVLSAVVVRWWRRR